MCIYLKRSDPILKDLDSLLRCGICYEYMKTTMVTNCSHNYCSLCIRKFLTYKTQCPACFEVVYDSQLRKNKIVDTFIELYQGILDYVDTVNIKHINNASDETVDETESECNILNTRQQFFGTIKEDPIITEKDLHSHVQEKLTNSKTDVHTCSKPSTSFFSLNIGESDLKVLSAADENGLKDVTKSNLSKAGSSKQFQSPSKVQRNIISMFSPRKNNGVKHNMVPCPVCNVDIPEVNINIHLDDCLKRSEKVPESSSKKVQNRSLMPKLVYSLVSEKELRKRLKDLGLNNQGDRKTLVNRHQRYTLLYNSECDSSNPRSAAQLIQQIEKEEKEEKKITITSTSSIMKIDRKTDPKVIEQAQKHYLHENKKSYDDLIEEIRSRNANKALSKPNRIESDDEDTNTIIAEDCKPKTPNKQTTQRNFISDDDSTDIEEGNHFPSVADEEADKCRNENRILEIDTFQFESDDGDDENQSISPVLGKHAGTVSTNEDQIKEVKGNEVYNVTPDMFESQLVPHHSNSYNCCASNDSLMLLRQGALERTEEEKSNAQQTENCQEQPHRKLDSQVVDTDILPDDEENCQKQSHRKVDSQIVDPDFVPDDEEEGVSQDFVIEKRTRKKRKSRKTSVSQVNSSSSTETRTLRKRLKY